MFVSSDRMAWLTVRYWMRLVTKECPPVPPSKVELYAAIRRDARAGMSGRAIEKKYRVGRRTIVRALSSAWPEPRKQLPPRASRLDPFKLVIDEILTADLDAPRKQPAMIRFAASMVVTRCGQVTQFSAPISAWIRAASS